MIKIIYNSSHNSDMFYAVKAMMFDSFFYFNINGEKIVFLDHRDYKVFEEEKRNKDIKVVLIEPLIEEFNKEKVCDNPDHNFAYHLIKKYGILDKEIYIPSSFPIDLAEFLRENGVKLSVLNPFFKEREIKNDDEIRAIENCLKHTYEAYDRIKEILKNSNIKGENVLYNGTVLTSEYLKYEVEKTLLKYDIVFPEGLIISSAKQSAIPHHLGAGPIKANSPIIIDLYPRDRKTGYFADMTRTFFKGEPSRELVDIYEAVKKVQAEAIKIIGPDKTGKDIYLTCVKMFEELGYPQKDDQGFIHGTGHGLGIDVHEDPCANNSNEKKFTAGNIVTIEPALYYSSLGGVRIEDDILITENGNRNLVEYEKELLVF